MPKIVKIPLKITAFLIGLGFVLLLVFQMGWFKNFVAQKATSYLTEELGVTVSLGEVQIDYFDAITVFDFFIEDENKDTLVYIQELQLDYDLLTFSKEKIKLDEVIIERAIVYIGIPKGETKLNINFLINYFKRNKKKKTAPPTVISLDKVVLKNTSFRYFNKNKPTSTDRKFDENDMLYTHINGHLHDFVIIKDSLNFIIEDISGNEKSGLVIDNLSAAAIVSPSRMRFEELEIVTPQSKISNFLEFNYKEYKDFSDFINTVKLNASFEHSTIHSNDLALFSNALIKYNTPFYISGNVDGTIANLQSKKLELGVGGHTRFMGRARLVGLPDIYKTRFDVFAKYLNTNARDLAKLIEMDPVPKEFLNLGDIGFKGNFNGLLLDFDVDAELATSVGVVKSRMYYQQISGGDALYNGTIQSDDLNLGELLGKSALGGAVFDLSVNGRGLTIENLSSKVSGDVSSIAYNNYVYQNISLNGNVKDEVFAGFFKIQDPNYNFDFDGKLDMSTDQPEIAIKANVIGVNLKTLGLDSSNTFIQFNGDVNVKGATVNEIVGSALLDSFRLTVEDRFYLLKDIKIIANRTSDNRHYSFHSDLASIDVGGSFLPTELESIVGYIKHAIYPAQFARPIDSLESESVVVKVRIEEYKDVFEEVFGKVNFDSANMFFSYDHLQGKIVSRSNISKFKYDDFTTSFIDLDLKNGGGMTPINFGINTGGLNQNDSILFDKLNANGFIKDGVVNFETTSQQDSILDIMLTGRLTYQRDSIEVHIDQSKLDIYSKPWELRKTDFPNILYTNGVTDFRHFEFRNGEEILFVDATTGFQSDKINVNLMGFKLENLTPFLAGYDIQFRGITNGYIDVSDREGFPIIEADLEIADMQLDGDTLGTLKLLSVNKDDLLAVAIDGTIEGGLLNDMKILGHIDFKDKKSPLNLKLNTEQSSIKPFEKYLNGLASNMSGYSTTDISITGPLTSPNLNGEMQLDSLRFKVDYLQTDYTANATVSIDYNSFSITESSLYDRFGNKGKISGKVSHADFKNFRFDINISDLDNFEIMNTQRVDNELFYGTAFAKGNMLVSGPMDDILLQINARSEKGTNIFIPLEDSEAGGKLSYVEFVNLKLDNNQVSNPFNTIAGVRMDFNFEITNDASISLIFDELLGDKIEAVGHGNLRMEINTYGDFNMYGGLTIDQGSYLFTALDLINKYFTVSPGGTLFWEGNPYNAKISLEAIKREYPVPKILMTGSVQSDQVDAYSNAIPVDCLLKLTGLLFNPEVTFDLKFPSQGNISGSATSAMNTVIERIRSDPEEVNRQVFALLVLGTFIPPSFATEVEGAGILAQGAQGAASAGVNSLSDFASSQLNNWLGQLDTRFQVGVDYQQNLNTKQNAEFILSLRRKWLNDRLEVSASVDAAAEGSRPYDISIKYDINKEGNLKVRGFKKQANDPTLGDVNNINTTGVGLFYRYQFDKFRLRRKKRNLKRKV